MCMAMDQLFRAADRPDFAHGVGGRAFDVFGPDRKHNSRTSVQRSFLGIAGQAEWSV